MILFLIAIIAVPVAVAAYLVITFKCGGVNPPAAKHAFMPRYLELKP